MGNAKVGFGEGSNQSYLAMTGIVLLVNFWFINPVAAQDKDRIRVKSGGKIGSHDFTYAAYRFPTFQPAEIHYYSGGPAAGNLNYNQLLGEMHFIGPNKDTLALDNLYLVKLISIGETKFYYDPVNKTFGELIADYPEVKLLITHKFKPSDVESGVAYGQYSNTSATTNYGSIATGAGRMQKLNINEYLVLAKRASYYLSDQNNQFHLANKANIYKLFSKNKGAMEKFVKENRIDFQKEEDLKKLLSFGSQLK